MVAGMAAIRPTAVANRASAIPGATTASEVVCWPAIALKLAEAGYDVAITCNSSVREARAVVERIDSLGRRAVAIRQAPRHAPTPAPHAPVRRRVSPK